ncbi:MAG: hypothetical protein HYX67_02615 [Candidatus Melainabacteria bacterium]|nr:hypothetical protein [Candidatus Melainabacteria bacterium]
MNFDSRAIVSRNSVSPLKLHVFIPCMAGLFLFVAGVVVGKSLPTQVTLSAAPDPGQIVIVKAHGRFGSPRWLQQQQPTLVADVQ